MAKDFSDDDLKLYYAIGEVADLIGVPTSKIRFWDREFPHLKPSKNTRNERRFSKENIRQLREINHLVNERGFTLEGARREIAASRKIPRDKQAVIDGLLAAKQRLQSLL